MHFANMDQATAEVISTGKTIIDLFLGSSDLLTPDAAIAAIEKSLCATLRPIVTYCGMEQVIGL